MTEHREDEDLRESFARLRRAIEPIVPGARCFVESAARRSARSSDRSRRRRESEPSWIAARATRRIAVWSRFAIAGLVAALTVTALWTARQAPDSRHTRRAEDPERRALGAQLENGLWRAPTDFLLDVPGADLLRTTPSIGPESRALSVKTSSAPDRSSPLPAVRRITT